jgi:hypothetical protein
VRSLVRSRSGCVSSDGSHNSGGVLLAGGRAGQRASCRSVFALRGRPSRARGGLSGQSRALLGVAGVGIALTFTSLAAAGYSGVVSSDSPAAYWRFGESAGTVAEDETANGNDGTYLNGVTLGASGAIIAGDDAVTLDGTNDYIKVANDASLNPTSALTLEAWVKPTSGGFSSIKPLLVKGYTSHTPPYYQYQLAILDSGGFPKYIQFSLSIGGTRVDLNKANSGWQYGVWNHIVATYDGSAMRIYLNGDEVASKSQTGSISTYSTPLAMGCFENLTKSSTYCYKGDLDELAVYGTALSAARVEAHYVAATEEDPDPPANTALPSTSGEPAVGRVQTATAGEWDNFPDSYAYQWRRCDEDGQDCSDISGADESTYTPVAQDVDGTLRVAVTATNSAGSTTAVSVQTDIIGDPPVNTTVPAITGTATERHTLIAGRGTWDTTPTRFSYQWHRCDSAGSNCAPIHGAIADVYTLTSADAFSRLKVTVTAKNRFASTEETSPAHDAVAPGQVLGNSTFSDMVQETSPESYWGIGETVGTTGAVVDHANGHNGSYHPSVNGNTLERGSPGVPIPGTLDEGIRVADVANISGGGGSGQGYLDVPGISSGGTASFSVNVWVKWAGYRTWGASDLNAGIIGNLRNDGSPEDGAFSFQVGVVRLGPELSPSTGRQPGRVRCRRRRVFPSGGGRW